MARAKRSATEERKRQVSRQLESVRSKLATKTREHYANENTYIRQRRRAQELAGELEAELSALQCPGEYEELPVAIVADELGLSYNQVRGLIKSGEIEATGRQAHERVSREELARIAALGATEILRLYRQESAKIFAEAVPHLMQGDVKYSEWALRRLEARGGWQGSHTPAFLVGLEMIKGEFDDALSSVRLILEMKDPLQRRATLAYLGQLLREINSEGCEAQAFREQLLAIVEGASAKGGTFKNFT